MFYAKYRTSNGSSQGAWFISHNPDQGGYKATSKIKLWRQIYRNASFMRDMVKFGKVHFYVRNLNGVITSIIMYANKSVETVAQKG